MLTLLRVLSKFDGVLRQFLVDDKGGVAIIAFGYPNFSHEDDASRAVQAAIEIHKDLKNVHNVSNSIGITTGICFVGTVGSSTRYEYAMVGDVVNLSARLMVAARNSESDFPILIDHATAFLAPHLHFLKLKPIKVKVAT